MITSNPVSRKNFEINEMKNETPETILPKAEELLKEARNLFKTAEDELNHGIEAFYDLMEHKKPELRSISEWHFRHCIKRAGKARETFLAAQDKLQSAKRLEYCRLKIFEIGEVYLKANEFLDKLTKKTRKTTVGGR